MGMVVVVKEGEKNHVQNKNGNGSGGPPSYWRKGGRNGKKITNKNGYGSGSPPSYRKLVFEDEQSLEGKQYASEEGCIEQ